MFWPHVPTYGEIALFIMAGCAIIRATPTLAVIIHSFVHPDSDESEHHH